MQHGKDVPLSDKLCITARVVADVLQGKSLGDALEGVPYSLRPAAQALSFDVLRHFSAGQALLGQLTKQKPHEPVYSLLLCVLALLYHKVVSVNDSNRLTQIGYDDYTLVNQAVQTVKINFNQAKLSGFVNAVLRQYLRKQSILHEQLSRNEVVRYNAPKWWINKTQQDHPKSWQKILQANQCKAPLVLRVNVREHSVRDYESILQKAEVSAQRVGYSALALEKAKSVDKIIGFNEGWVSVQDAGAQMAASLLRYGLVGDCQSQTSQTKIGKPFKILDACAAPGGKTAHILETLNAQVLALEIDRQRIQRIHTTLKRLKLQAKVVCADASKIQTWFDEDVRQWLMSNENDLSDTEEKKRRLFDAVVLDAPCSASGIVRRHPDIPWLRRESDVRVLAQTQAKLLSELWPLVQMNGFLLYCTCSIFLQEGVEQIKEFSKKNKNVQIVSLAKINENVDTPLPYTQLHTPWGMQLLPTLENEFSLENFAQYTKGMTNDSFMEISNHDGYFYSLLKKTANM